MSRQILELNGHDLTLTQIADLLDQHPQVVLADTTQAPMQDSVDAVRAAIAADRPSYGINTGFGALATTRISPEQLIDLQYNLVRSHCSGVGAPLPDAIVRIMMLLKANSLAVGVSGIRPAVVETLLALLNADVIPVIPAQGSVGASGDLAPLAHLTLALIGEGEALKDGRRLSGVEVLEAAGQQPVRLEAKEGLALVNGTQASAALAITNLFRAETLLKSAIVTGALSVEAAAGSYAPFDDRIHQARKLAPQIRIAEQFRTLLTESEIHSNHQECGRVQDPYSIRCMPQVFGAILGAVEHAAEVLGRECNAVSDNPLIFGDDVISGGNFHAAPIGLVCDYLAIAVAELGSITERRIDLHLRRVNPALQMFLASQPGIESGYMIAQVTAAALCSENKTLAHPASVDSIPTSAGQEDHVSMAPWAAMKCMRICDNTSRILAIELLTAIRAITAQSPLRTTPALKRVHDFVVQRCPEQLHDHRLDSEIEAAAQMINAAELFVFLPQHELLIQH